MPLFMIERNFADQPEVTCELAEGIVLVNEDIGVSWLFSFLSADNKKKTYCLYEAPSVQAISDAAKRAGLPAGVIVEVSGQIQPDGTFIQPKAG